MNFITNIAGLITASESGFPKVTAGDVLANGLNIFYFVCGVVAVLAIIIAGFYFVSDGSNPTTITKAKNTIVYSVVGLIVISAAFAITQFVIRSF